MKASNKAKDRQDKILTCPYCGDEKSGIHPMNGCCGESSDHFVWMTEQETEETWNK